MPVAVVLIILSLLLGAGSLTYASSDTIITKEHIQYINDLFKQRGIKNGYVDLDRYGRIKLLGEYEDEYEVDRAFAIAQSAVGYKWVSPVTPENIKVKEWEKVLSDALRRFAERGFKKVVKDTSPPGPVRNKYALLVGVGTYNDKRISELPYAKNDVYDLYNYLIDPRGGGFKKENVIVLVEQQATRSNILNAMNSIKSKAEPDDLVLVYASTHGTPPDKYGGVHLVTYDAEVEPEARIWHTAVTDKAWKEFVEGLRAKRVVLILDICFSSGAFAYIPGISPPGGKSLGVVGVESYSINKDYAKRVTGAKDLIIEEPPKVAQKTTPKSASIQEDGWGLVLLSSSSGSEKSWMDDSIRKSYFTHYLVDGLRKHNGSVRDAFYYAKPIVQNRVPVEKKYYDVDKSTGRQQLVVPTQTPQVYVTNEKWNIKLGK